jgi:hypothetical protein
VTAREAIAMKSHTIGFAAAALLFTALAWPTPLTAGAPAQEQVDEAYHGYAMSMGNIATGARGRIQLYITRWTPDEERQHLAQALVQGGNEALRDAFDQVEETGRIRVGTRNSYPLYYAREFMLDSGIRRIILGTNRPISFIEAAANPRTRDYDLSLIIIDLEADDTGSGIAAVGVQLVVNPDNGVLQIENYGTEPVRLTNIKRDR